MYWFPKTSLYDEAEAARLKRNSNAQSYLASNSSLASSFIGATVTATQNAASLTMQIATQRVRSQFSKLA